ncbi:RusA family crossover junction endodeoxyribonuclease [Clostridium tetani]|uniref:Phage protein n=1 Tax=Clostridium tetani TaxID=1513 RepID=A0ABC8ECY3_CLOTA|nr:RusA family crossover junction endodeoxyribonuclease [Clostridium tetani]BDR81048.1 phage protein [Clostridium tetani]
MKLIIPGEPKGKARPRMSTKTGRAYTPEQTVQYENWVKTCYTLSNDKNKLEGTIKAEIKAYMSIPKSTSKKKRQEMLEGKIRPTKKPDVDNIVKIILDSLNKLAFDDDKQVVDCSIEKWYGEDPRVELELLEVE